MKWGWAFTKWERLEWEENKYNYINSLIRWNFFKNNDSSLKNNQVWDCKNVFVSDGACMTSASCVNPSLTYMAMTARAAHIAVEELKKGNL